MKNILIVCSLFISFFLNAQVIKIENGISHSSTKYNKEDKCYHNGFAGLISIDYFQKKNYYLSSRIGYTTTGYFAYDYDFAGYPVNRHKAIAEYFSFSTSIRGTMPVFNAHIYVGFGAKIDYCLNKLEKTPEFQTTNKFKNMFGPIIDLGCYKDFNKYRIGINISYLTNSNMIPYNVKKNIYSLYLGYNFSNLKK